LSIKNTKKCSQKKHDLHKMIRDEESGICYIFITNLLFVIKDLTMLFDNKYNNSVDYYMCGRIT